MKKLLAKLGLAPSVNSILKGFNKTISDLHALAEAHEAQHDRNISKIMRLNNHNAALLKEADSALTVAGRLRDLVGTPH